MSRRPPLAVVTNPAAPSGQMSPANRFDSRPGLDRGRGRGAQAARAVSVAPVITRHQSTLFWAALVKRRCVDSREECAVVFGVTFQTACNWFDGFSCPTGDKVLMAIRLWPEEFVDGGV